MIRLNYHSSLEDFAITSTNSKAQATDYDTAKATTVTPTVRPRQNVVLMEDIIYNPGRQGRPHK